MKFLYDPDHAKVTVEPDSTLPFEITDRQVEIIALCHMGLALDTMAKALASASETLKHFASR
jgi:hypothetical protein